MFFATALLGVLGLATSASAVGSECGSDTLGSGNAAASDPFWYEAIDHTGTAAFGETAAGTYKVYRNVKDYGAVGDGTTDDTAAIQQAIADQDRCGLGCNSTTTTPAVIYFPTGTYAISAPIISYYYTTLLGDAKNPPTVKALSGFANTGTGYDALFECDPYIPGGNGANYWTNQNNFFRSVRNFILDTTALPATDGAFGVHWQVAQATSLQNIVVNMNSDAGSQHVGIYMENGSGGFISDITTNGGLHGFLLGNQQFTYRNLVSNNAVNGIFTTWNWGMTFINATVTGATNAFNLTTGGDSSAVTTGAVYILDSSASDCTNFVAMSTVQTDRLNGSIVIDNAALSGVTNAVLDPNGAVLAGSDSIDLWAQGNVAAVDGTLTYQQDALASYTKPSGLLADDGKVFMKSRPQYEAYTADQFASVMANGAKGDGVTDDTAAIQKTIDSYAGCKIIYFDSGTYLVTDTISIPVDTVVVGEFFPVILASGDAFADETSPKVLVQVGKSGDTGSVEISNMIFGAVGGSSGAIAMEWNVAGDAGATGMWDAHFRFGGALGTNLQVANCGKANPASDGSCNSGYLAFHVTEGASGYFENNWVWNADHDLDDPAQGQISIYSARGVLHESTAASWYIGHASEHHVMYQYNFNGAANVFVGLAQTETPYFQPQPAPPAPYTANTDLADPAFGDDQTSAWAVYIQNSKDMIFGGTGFYSFFSNYAQDCLDTYNCQNQIVNVDAASTGIRFYNLNTVASSFQLSVGASGIVNQADNQDGFQETLTFWTSDASSAKKSDSVAKKVNRLRRSAPRVGAKRLA